MISIIWLWLKSVLSSFRLELAVDSQGQALKNMAKEVTLIIDEWDTIIITIINQLGQKKKKHCQYDVGANMINFQCLG